MVRWRNVGLVLVTALVGGCGGSPASDSDAASAELDVGMDDARADASPGFDLLIETEILAFGDVCVGLSSDTVELSIANASSTASPPIRASLAGRDAASFEIVSSTCDDGVAPRAFCAVRLVLAPSSSTVLDASLELAVGERSFTVMLEGRAVLCDGLTVGPSPHSFGHVAVGEVSAPVTFTVENSGDETSGVLSASITGTDASQFSLVPGPSDGCSRRALGSGASCTVDVVFAPTTAGSFSASLTIEEPLGVPSVALTGIGD